MVQKCLEINSHAADSKELDLIDELHQYRCGVDIFNKIISLTPSIKEYDFTLNSILKQINKVFNIPISSMYIRHDNGVYTLVSEPVTKNCLKCHTNSFLSAIKEQVSTDDGFFEITWGRNLVIGDYSHDCGDPAIHIFPLESKGEKLGFWAIPSSEEKNILEERFISMISQQITLLVNYSWLYKKQGMTVRSNLHRLSAINEVCKLFADINGRDFGLQFLLILLEHISADKGLLVLLNDDETIKDYHCVGFEKYRIREVLDDKKSLPVIETFKCEDVKTGIISNAFAEDNADDTSLTYYGLPLVGVQGKIGVVFIFFKTQPAEEDLLAFFKTMASLAGTHFESIELYSQYLEKRLMEEQINIARQIQRELLPKGTPKLEHFLISAESRPATQVGGDFYDFIDLPPDRHAIMIGDVSGKGIPASQLMSMTKSLLKFHLANTKSLSQMMFDVNNYLAAETPTEKFVTVQAIVIDNARRKVEVVNAGHEFLLIYKPSEDSFTEIKPSDIPLGIFPNMKFKLAEIDFQSGDILLLFTDGLPEAMSPDKTLFGMSKMHQVLKTSHELDVEEILAKFFQELEIHAAGGAQHDDTTIIVLKAK